MTTRDFTPARGPAPIYPFTKQTKVCGLLVCLPTISNPSDLKASIADVGLA